MYIACIIRYLLLEIRDENMVGAYFGCSFFLRQEIDVYRILRCFVHALKMSNHFIYYSILILKRINNSILI